MHSTLEGYGPQGSLTGGCLRLRSCTPPDPCSHQGALRSLSTRKTINGILRCSPNLLCIRANPLSPAEPEGLQSEHGDPSTEVHTVFQAPSPSLPVSRSLPVSPPHSSNFKLSRLEKPFVNLNPPPYLSSGNLYQMSQEDVIVHG